jgi:hypothetical protein
VDNHRNVVKAKVLFKPEILRMCLKHHKSVGIFAGLLLQWQFDDNFLMIAFPAIFEMKRPRLSTGSVSQRFSRGIPV